MVIRPIELVRASWGLGLLAAPRYMLTHLGVELDTTSLVVTRILGARHLTQAFLSGADPSPEVLAMGAWVDAAHSATALALAALDRPRARAGLTDAAVAAFFGAAGFRDVPRIEPAPPGHDRRRDVLARVVLAHVPGGHLLLARCSPTGSDNTMHTSLSSSESPTR